MVGFASKEPKYIRLKKVIKARLAKRLSQQDVADRIRSTKFNVHRVEAGHILVTVPDVLEWVRVLPELTISDFVPNARVARRPRRQKPKRREEASPEAAA